MTLSTGATRSNVERRGPYAGSVAQRKIAAAPVEGRRPRIAFLDIDSTLTGNPLLADESRRILEHAGYVVAFVTSRTEEMIMSRRTYGATVAAGEIDRPPPQLGDDGGRRFYRPPEECEPVGVLDGDIIAGSTGTRILVRSDDGAYTLDREYEGRYGQSSQEWRQTALDVFEAVRSGGCNGNLASIEHPELYARGQSDIAPPNYRLQLNFDTLEDKIGFVSTWRRTCRAMGRRNLRITDDSKPEVGAFKVFVTPRRGSKVRAVQEIVRRLCDFDRVELSRLQLLLVGDSFPDLGMGLFGGLGTDATLLLVGGSRLADSLIEPGVHDFAGEPLNAVRRHLSPTGHAGQYRFRLPLRRLGVRTLIIGDESYPGTEAVETVHRYLSSAVFPVT